MVPAKIGFRLNLVRSASPVLALNDGDVGLRHTQTVHQPSD